MTMMMCGVWPMSDFLMIDSSWIVLTDGMIHWYIRTICDCCFEMRIDAGFWMNRIDNVRHGVDGVIFFYERWSGVICSRLVGSNSPGGSSYYKSFRRRKTGCNKGLRS
jgi:hypothetical protein